MRNLGVIFLAAVFTSTLPLLADGPKDNQTENVRRVPRLGVDVTEKDRLELQFSLGKLDRLIDQLQHKKDAHTKRLLPDVQIYHRGVSTNLEHQEFFKAGEITAAKSLVADGIKRAEQLLAGNAPWTTQTGLVVRGYLSRIDKTVQPYGLVIPESYSPTGTQRFRCDMWYHGRGETLSETNFINSRQKQVGQYAPEDTFVLHPYGRYSNAFKFAGEVDVLEALESVKQNYRIDENRIASRGFSMGGAACWQFAVHYSDRWFAANPGAGFSETPEFLKFFQKETLNPTWYEKKLWHLYDCTDYAINLFHCPTVAYSGEVDTQKQAADIMETALAKEGIRMRHIIGPDTAHRIHPDSKVIVERALSELANLGRQQNPDTVHLTTYTLKYNRMHWVTLNAMGEHWKRARIDAVRTGNKVKIKTENVTDVSFSFASGEAPFDMTQPVLIEIDGQQIKAASAFSDRSWSSRLYKQGEKWVVGTSGKTSLVKRHNLQGPIDDAFMGSFIFVRPSGKCANPKIEKWVQAELNRAIVHWRRHFRGDAIVKKDTEITKDDIQSSNLILWGDTVGNVLLDQIADQLPIQWSVRSVVAGERRFSAETHVPILIHPNPLNPSRYVVLNSSFTFREFAYLNNARQVPMLPDWAIVDVRTPPGSQYPGKIVAADFFGESWELRPAR